MIDWDSPHWGGGVTYAANGSWVSDRHERGSRLSAHAFPEEP